jgi:hypothetical protein
LGSSEEGFDALEKVVSTVVRSWWGGEAPALDLHGIIPAGMDDANAESTAIVLLWSSRTFECCHYVKFCAW